MFTPDKKGSAGSPLISPPMSLFAQSPNGTATPDPPQQPPVLPMFPGRTPSGGSKPAGGPEKIITCVQQPRPPLVRCQHPKFGTIFDARLIQCPVCGTMRNHEEGTMQFIQQTQGLNFGHSHMTYGPQHGQYPTPTGDPQSFHPSGQPVHPHGPSAPEPSPVKENVESRQRSE